MSQFCLYYPGVSYWTGWKQTADGAIPWRVFEFLYSNLSHILALERLNLSTAVGHAIAVHLSSKENLGEIHKAIDKLNREAFPTVPI